MQFCGILMTIGAVRRRMLMARWSSGTDRRGQVLAGTIGQTKRTGHQCGQHQQDQPKPALNKSVPHYFEFNANESRIKAP